MNRGAEEHAAPMSYAIENRFTRSFSITSGCVIASEAKLFGLELTAERQSI